MSIVAKVWRDRYICEQANLYSGYYLEQNKGYGTAKHMPQLKNWDSPTNIVPLKSLELKRSQLRIRK